MEKYPFCENKPEKKKECKEIPLAMAYVPMQKLCKTYDLSYGIKAGTIFPELYKPFCGKGGCCR